MNLAVFFAIGLAGLQCGEALNCYACKPTSMTTACADPLSVSSNDVSAVTCPVIPPNFLCLKVVGKFANGSTGVMRDCVLNSAVDEQCRAFGHIMSTVNTCTTCSGDLCNDSPPTIARTTFIFSSSLFLLWLSRR